MPGNWLTNLPDLFFPARPSAGETSIRSVKSNVERFAAFDIAPMRLNLILVPVVVRGNNGKIIPDSHTQDDFQLIDDYKPQPISSSSVETSASQIVLVKSDAANPTEPTAGCLA